MDNELTELNQQSNHYANMLEAVARKLRAGEPWHMRMDEIGNLLVPVAGEPATPGPAHVTALAVRRNELLRTPLTTAA